MRIQGAKMLVKELMTTDLMIIKRNESVKKAQNIFENNSFRHLPIVEDGRVLGVISDRDINRSIAISATVSEMCGVEMDDDLKVESIMTKNFISIGPDDNLKEAGRIMMERKIGCLPVIKNEKLVGIITETDILKRFIEMCD